MKKILSILTLFFAMTIGFTAYAQDAAKDSTPVTEQPTQTPVAETPVTTEAAPAEEPQSFHQVIKTKFIEGGWEFMSTVLICLIIGLAIAIERIIVLSLASSNVKKLLSGVEEALNNGGHEKAREFCASQRGPVASIFAQGLMSARGGVEMVEKSIVSYGSVEMSKLERGLVWISLFIALAPMLGFLGTVVGMIDAFDAIQAAGDISPSLVAGGIKVALLTTVGGLIVAMILQVLYNFCVSKIDSLVSDMEESSIAMVDLLIRHEYSSKK